MCISNAGKFIITRPKERVVIFGIGDYARLARWYLENDSDLYKPFCFCVDEEFKKEDQVDHMDVVTYKEVIEKYSPDFVRVFAPMSPRNMNKDRASVYARFKELGYSFINYISSAAHVMGRVEGDNNFILEGNVIQPFVKIGSNNVFWSGNHIGHHSVIGNHNTFTSHVVLSGHCEVGDACFFGVNSTVRDRTMIADGTLLGQGANLLMSTEAGGAYLGNPAKKIDKKSYELL
jgi:sugar O-acyltransferase (sialic acid O-acetyltransferase NeuD family)